MVFPAGTRITAVRMEKLVSRGNRTTAPSTSASTTEVGVLRLDGIAVKGGYLYVVTTSNLWFQTTDATGIPRAFLRYATGTNPTATTASAEMDAVQFKLGSTTASEVMGLQGEYAPTNDTMLSVLLTYNRAAGAGTISMQAGSYNPTPPIRMYVVNMGPDPGDNGIDI